MSDVVVLLCLALSKGRVADAKWLVKDSSSTSPASAGACSPLGCVFLKREKAADEGTIRSSFRRYSSSTLPLWLMSFPEGTRITPAKLAASRAYARRAGLRETSRVLLPRPSGFVTSVTALRERVQAVYIVTIRYPGVVPTLPALIRGEIGEVEAHVQRVAVGDLPRNGDGLAAWLRQQFYGMDARLSSDRR